MRGFPARSMLEDKTGIQSSLWVIWKRVGGLLTKTSTVENFPGYVSVLGADLMDTMQKQAIACGAKIIEKKIVNANLLVRPFVLTDDSKNVYFCTTVIIATGSTPRKLSLPDESKFWGHGISSCAV